MIATIIAILIPVVTVTLAIIMLGSMVFMTWFIFRALYWEEYKYTGSHKKAFVNLFTQLFWL